jgi:hypothetical protein
MFQDIGRICNVCRLFGNIPCFHSPMMLCRCEM